MDDNDDQLLGVACELLPSEREARLVKLSRAAKSFAAKFQFLELTFNRRGKILNMKNSLLLLAVALLVGFSTDTFAQRSRYDPYNDHADRQRIRRGVRYGQITRHEARILRERERQIRAERRGYRSDRVLTRDERREIWRDEREQDRRIREYRHNNARRAGYYRRHHRGYDGRYYHHRGNGYYRRGAGSPTHPRFGYRRRY